jgi:hypothetical protein
MTVRVLDEVPDSEGGRGPKASPAPRGVMGPATADLRERAAIPDRRRPGVTAVGRPGASTRNAFLSGPSFQDGAEIAGEIRAAGGGPRGLDALPFGLSRNGATRIAATVTFGGCRPMAAGLVPGERMPAEGERVEVSVYPAPPADPDCVLASGGMGGETAAWPGGGPHAATAAAGAARGSSDYLSCD